MKKATGFLLTWALIVFALAAAICGVAGNGNLLTREMFRHAPPETTGLPEREYAGVGRMTAGYLAGQEETFQYSFSDGEGNTYLCFRSYEADHMADCRQLIRLAGTVRWIAGGLAMILAGMAVVFRKRLKEFTKGMSRGLTAAGAVFSLLLIWGLLDFDGLFTTFHRIAFTNDGWLLDPRTDLLIRLMPASFFVSLGIRVLLAVAVMMLLIFVTVAAIRAAEKRTEQRGA